MILLMKMIDQSPPSSKSKIIHQNNPGCKLMMSIIVVVDSLIQLVLIIYCTFWADKILILAHINNNIFRLHLCGLLPISFNDNKMLYQLKWKMQTNNKIFRFNDKVGIMMLWIIKKQAT